MTKTLKDAIAEAISAGRMLELDYDTLLSLSDNPKALLPQVSIDLDIPLSSVYQLAGVMQGGNLLELLPASLVPQTAQGAAAVTLASVDIVLIRSAQKIGLLTCTIGFGPKASPPANGFEGIDWTIAHIASAPLSVGLKALAIGVSSPGEPGRALTASVSGDIKVASAQLNVFGSYPDGVIQISQPDGAKINLGAFVSDFGLTPSAFLNDLFLQDTNFMITVPQKAGFVNAGLTTSDRKPLTLVPGSGSRALFALESMSLHIDYAPGQTDVVLMGTFLVLEGLAFTILAKYQSGGAWGFEGYVDVSATLVAIGKPDAPDLNLGALADIFVPGSGDKLPSVLQGLGLKQLSFAYAHPAPGTGTSASEDTATYKMVGEVDGTWDIDGGLSADLCVELTESEKKFSAEFDMHGFAFTLGVDIADTTSVFAQIDAVVDRQDLKVSGTYSDGILDITTDTPINVAMLVAWFVGSVTGQRFYVLPEPWDEILSAIRLPAGLDVNINTKTGAVKVTDAVSYSFLVFQIDSFSISYTPGATDGKSGISFELKGKLPGDSQSLSWDPATETPPDVPGKGSSVLRIDTAAAGQHFAFDQTPAGIADAVSKVGQSLAVSDWTSTPADMKFATEAGWLFAAQIKILGQADLKFIFNDPQIYGVEITVTKGKNDKLNVLDGLYAEVLYRKVSDSVGVYEGTLVLPNTIRKINFGAFEITLPSFYLAIYTNGDFKVDVGFPYNFDFSKSLSLTVEIYSGAAGFYYAKLDGLDPKALPQISSDQGVFNPVTEIGIGLELGIQKGFESGPLSARFALMVQGLFQGTFATYHDFASGKTDEYYDVQAQVAIFGELYGTINFVIIQASLDVKVFVRAGVHLKAHEPTTISFSAGVEVELTVTINLWIFKIHIHLSFKMTVHGSTTFGEPTPKLWDDKAQSIRVDASVVVDDPPPAWQPIAPTGRPVPLSVYVLPALTAGADYTDTSNTDPAWIYVVQLGLSNPASAGQGAQANLANASDPSYADFLTGVLRWGLYAASGKSVSGSDPVDQASVDATSVTQVQIEKLNTSIAAGLGPDMDAITALFVHGFATTIGKPPATSGSAPLGVGFFPALPGMSVSVETGSGGARDLPQSILATDAVTAPMALAHVQTGAASHETPPSQGPGDSVLVDYVTLALRSALQKAHDASAFAQSESVAISTILKDAADDLASIAGLTSRFMLHGTRRMASNDTMEPLYALTGQQVLITKAEMDDTTLSLSLKFDAGDQETWNASFADQGDTITFTAADQDAVIKAPAQLPASPDLPDVKPTVVAAPTFDLREIRYTLTGGIAVSQQPGTSFWRLPQTLKDYLASSAAAPVALYKVSDTDPTAPGIPIDGSDYAWALGLEFDVAQIPLPGATAPKSPQFLKNTYLISSVNQKGLVLLRKLLAALQEPNPTIAATSLWLGHRAVGDGSGGVSTLDAGPVDFSKTFMVQSNFSTETRPPEQRLAVGLGSVPIDPAETRSFLGKLWSAGVTASGGYFLYEEGEDGQGLPEALFAGSNRATLSLMIGLTPGGAAPLAVPGYVNTIVASGLTASAGLSPYYVAAQNHEDAHPLVTPGLLAMEVTRTPPGEPTDYPAALDQLYNLYAGRVTKIASQTTNDVPAVFGPTKPPTQTTDLYYRHSFALVPEASDRGSVTKSGTLPDEFNPYQHVGEDVEISLERVDLFGNLWAGFNDGATLSCAYYDPLTSLNQLPYLSFTYVFSGTAAAPVLEVQFTFKPPVYVQQQGSDHAAQNRKTADLFAYAQAFYQISQIKNRVQVTATAATSLLPGVDLPVSSADIASGLSQAYTTIFNTEITPLASASPPAQIELVNLKTPVDPTKLAEDLTLPLTAALTLARSGPFAAGVPSESSVRSVTINIAPQMEDRKTSSTTDETDHAHQTTRTAPLSLDSFNAGFKAAFAAHDRVLAVGAAQDANAGTSPRQLWVVRYGATGIDPGFEPQAPRGHFAPRPLYNKLISIDIANAPILDVNGCLSYPEGHVLAKRDVDLDAEMGQALAAIDALFAPQLSIPAALVNAAALNKLSAAKKAIVEKLMGFVTSLDPGDPEPVALEAAQDKYRQECLIELANFYDMVSVVTLQLTTKMGDQASPPAMNAFGQPVSNDTSRATSKFYSLTSGKAALAASGAPMAIGLFAKNKTIRSEYEADLSFELGAIEHEIVAVKVGDTTFMSGGWLSFLDAPKALPVGEIKMPIPLRAFPTPPDLGVLKGVSLYEADASYNSGAEALEAAKSWSLNGAYQHPYVAQDSVELEILILNPGVSFGDLFAETNTDAIQAILIFTSLVPQLQDLFVNKGLADIRTTDKAANTELSNALETFADLADAIGTADWSGLAFGGLRNSGGAAGASYSRRYQIEDGVQARSSDPWASRISVVTPGSPDLDLIPQLAIAGYQTEVASHDEKSVTYTFVSTGEGPEKGTKLSTAEGATISARTIVGAPAATGDPFGVALNVVDRQSGTMTMQILRNATMPLPFRYETEQVSYAAPMAPMLDITGAIDVSDVAGPGSYALSDLIFALYQQLVVGSGQTTAIPGKLQLVVSFGYPATGSGRLDLDPVRLPVLFQLPVDVELGPKPTSKPGFVDHLASGVKDWMTANDLLPTTRADLWKQATLSFDVTLFADNSVTGAALIRLGTVSIACSRIDLS